MKSIPISSVSMLWRILPTKSKYPRLSSSIIEIASIPNMKKIDLSKLITIRKTLRIVGIVKIWLKIVRSVKKQNKIKKINRQIIPCKLKFQGSSQNQEQSLYSTSNKITTISILHVQSKSRSRLQLKRKDLRLMSKNQERIKDSGNKIRFKPVKT